jgi:hypothetical protein
VRPQAPDGVNSSNFRDGVPKHMSEIVFKGKEYVYNHHLSVPYRPLLADAKKGIGPADLGGNLVIHGDNLHALKRCCRATPARWTWSSLIRPTTPATKAGATATTSIHR